MHESIERKLKDCFINNRDTKENYWKRKKYQGKLRATYDDDLNLEYKTFVRKKIKKKFKTFEQINFLLIKTNNKNVLHYWPYQNVFKVSEGNNSCWKSFAKLLLT